MQTIQQTDEEKMAMYMKLSKKEIILMLIQCNKTLDRILDRSENQPVPVIDYRFPCNHNYIQKDAYWKSCTHCGACTPFIREAF